MNAPTLQNTAEAELNLILGNQRAAFKAEGPVALATRVDRIDRCIALLVDNKEAICEAVDKDFARALTLHHADDGRDELRRLAQVRQEEPEEVDEARETPRRWCR